MILEGIIAFFSLLMIVVLVMRFRWFPATFELRCTRRIHNGFKQYRAEVYRPFFGWTGFEIDRGTVLQCSEWHQIKQDCVNDIVKFQVIKCRKVRVDYN